MAIKISFDELFEIMRSYQFKQECIMDASDGITDSYLDAVKKWDAAAELKRILSEKMIEIFKEETGYYENKSN